MKRVIIFTTALLFAFGVANAQKIGYVNYETILSQIPAFTAAQQELDKLNQQYSDLIEAELSKIEAQFKSYQQLKSQMTPQQREVKENEIISAERVVQEKQKIYFGDEGILAKKSEELLKPIMDKLQATIDNYAKSHGYMIMIDVASMNGVIYKDPVYDLSAEIIKNLK